FGASQDTSSEGGTARATGTGFPEEATSAGSLRRRRVVVLLTLAVGTVFLAWSLHSRPDSPSFYWAAVALAVTWTSGSFASGPLHLG
ncbi:hypothetical protein ACSNOK_34885, partial [Streptomyces sp. URMC 126]|uniref:hypothetical protein n=1 Tax=Streptomyces sp. URMC 126 TaxID=3423401 RepID=UPI003F1CB5F6